MTLYNIGDVLDVNLKDPQLNTEYEAAIQIKEVTTITTPKGASTHYKAVIDSIIQTKPSRAESFNVRKEISTNLLSCISEAQLKSITRNTVSLGEV
ncbi:MAG TPA: hypothetical protein V6C58_26735 [Allocoleopsis sp.]